MDPQSSRDITNLSKKVIFLLHRVINTESASDDRTLSLHAAQEGRKKLGEVQLLFKAMRPELAGDRFWRYQHSVSPGLQEYIEALSFAYYIEHETLITYADVQRSLSDEEDGPVSNPRPVGLCSPLIIAGPSSSRSQCQTTCWACPTSQASSCASPSPPSPNAARAVPRLPK